MYALRLDIVRTLMLTFCTYKYQTPMPTILSLNGFQFSFFSADCVEPRHLHVRKGGCEAKYWLTPIRQEYNHGFKRSELRQIEAILDEHVAALIVEWDTWCGSS